MIAITTFKTSSIHHDVLCVNYGPIESKIEDKAGCASGRGLLVTDKSLPWRVSSSQSDPRRKSSPSPARHPNMVTFDSTRTRW